MRSWLRVFVMLAIFQISGQVSGVLPGMASFLARAEVACSASCSEDEDEQGLPCSPFCSNCTCVHARPVGLDRAPACAVNAPQLIAEQPLPSLDATTPQRPPPHRVFRPPRIGCV